MTRYRLTVGAVGLAFTLSALPAWAGQRPGGEGGGPGGGGGAGSDSRPSGGGGNSGGGSGGGSGSSSGSSSSTSSDSSGAPSYAPAPSRRESAVERAPQRPSAEQRRGGSGDRPRTGEPTGRAVPRGTTPSGGDSTTSSASEAREPNRVSSPRDRAVPAYSRPREGRTVTGRATERFTPIPDHGGGNGRYYYSPYPYGYYYDPYGYYGSYWYPGYAFGMGYFYYDPFWYGGYAPYGYQGGYSSGRYSYGPAGAVRLKIKPRDAQVFVDGYFVGTVDSFDGVFQRLSIDAGGHKLEIRAPGYQTLHFDVLITPGETVTYKGDLERVK